MSLRISNLPAKAVRLIIEFLLPRDILNLSKTSLVFYEVRKNLVQSSSCLELNRQYKLISIVFQRNYFALINFFTIQICQFNSDDIWKILFDRYFKSYCSLDDFNVFLDSNMNWKVLCRHIFWSNQLDPQLHRLVCNSCCFATQSSRDLSTGCNIRK